MTKYAEYNRDFPGDNIALLVACPRLDNFQAHQQKLNEILKRSEYKSLTVVHMEVPCCGGFVHMVKQAILNSGNVVPVRDITVGIRGEILSAKRKPVSCPVRRRRQDSRGVP